MTEEIIDLIFTLIRNSIGLALSFYICFTDMIDDHRSQQSTKESNYRPSVSEDN